MVLNTNCGSNREGVFSRKRVHIIIAKCEHMFTRRLHASQEEFKNVGFTRKTHQMFCIDTAREESNNVTITCQFGFVFEENIGQGNHVNIDYREGSFFAIIHQSIPAVPIPLRQLRGICSRCQSRGWGIRCLVPRPQYYASVIRFGSRGPGRKVWPRQKSGK